MKLEIIFSDASYLHTESVANLQKQFGSRVRELRSLAGMSREDYAAKVGLSPRRIASLELGQGWPRPATLEKIARSFGLDVRDIFDFTSTRTLPRKFL
jgi:transcriptional regulator with XRE-family HTH domain